MYIAREKRADKIAEYILYLWQLEDLIRALEFDPERMYTALIEPMAVADEEKENRILLWYVELGNLLKREGKESSGHLEHTLHLMADLQSLHSQLLKSKAGDRYRTLYARLEPELPRLKASVGMDGVSDVEICFRSLYAVMLYRMKGDTTKESSISDVIELISPLVGELARTFHLAEHGELDIWGEKIP